MEAKQTHTQNQKRTAKLLRCIMRKNVLENFTVTGHFETNETGEADCDWMAEQWVRKMTKR